jgi:hypothetical protein
VHRVAAREGAGEVAVVADRVSLASVQKAQVLAQDRVQRGDIVLRVEGG